MNGQSEYARRIQFLALAVLLGLFVLALITLPHTALATTNIDAEKAAIRDVLDGYVRAVETEDMDLYAQAVAHGPTMVNLGTGAEDRIVGWAALTSLPSSLNANPRHLRVAGALC